VLRGMCWRLVNRWVVDGGDEERETFVCRSAAANVHARYLAQHVIYCDEKTKSIKISDYCTKQSPSHLQK